MVKSFGEWAIRVGKGGLFEAAVNRENGQLVSMRSLGLELMHGGGAPVQDQTADDKRGWANSELTMFPNIGKPTDYLLQLGDQQIPMDQHGILRHLPWDVMSADDKSVVLRATYIAHTEIPNPRAKKDPNAPRVLVLPYSFTVDKVVEADQDAIGVGLTITNNSEQSMPYNIGWHPALKRGQNFIRTFTDESRETVHSVDDIVRASLTGATRAPGAVSCTYRIEDTRFEMIWAGQWSNAQLWSPEDSALLCVEPVSEFRDAPPASARVLQPQASATYATGFFLL